MFLFSLFLPIFSLELELKFLSYEPALPLPSPVLHDQCPSCFILSSKDDLSQISVKD